MYILHHIYTYIIYMNITLRFNIQDKEAKQDEYGGTDITKEHAILK
jgi:hypothetical protein